MGAAPMDTLLLLTLLLLMMVVGTLSLELRTMYRYSQEFRSMRTKMGMSFANEELEEETVNLEVRQRFGAKLSYAGTWSFYEKLLRHDRRRHRRLIDAAQTSIVSLAPSNQTTNIDSLGGLHYAIVTIGTPPKEFLVALDTGSDLLWVPCDCIECAKPNWSLYGVQDLLVGICNL